MVRYFGGKSRFVDQIVPFIESKRDGRDYMEPFMGSAVIASAVSGTRVCYDLNEYLIAMWSALQDGWLPPPIVPRKLFDSIKADRESFDPKLVGFVGMAYSFSGIWMEGYSDHGKANKAFDCRKSMLEMVSRMPKKEVTFIHADYRHLNPDGMIIYCDPPYKGVPDGYKHVTRKYGSFDHDLFWETMREWSADNIVIISEYTAPSDFRTVMKIPTSMTARCREKAGTVKARLEKLFMHRSIA